MKNTLRYLAPSVWPKATYRLLTPDSALFGKLDVRTQLKQFLDFIRADTVLRDEFLFGLSRDYDFAYTHAVNPLGIEGWERLFEHHREVKLRTNQAQACSQLPNQKSIAARISSFKYNELDPARDLMLQPVRE